MQWTRAQETLALRVPSAVVEQEWNVLLNPLHPDMPHVTIGHASRHHCAGGTLSIGLPTIAVRKARRGIAMRGGWDIHFFERRSNVGDILAKSSGRRPFYPIHPHESRSAPAHAAHDWLAYRPKVEDGNHRRQRSPKNVTEEL